jgi:Cof subfamily protein (haloacid dehalogenase superfamily)
MSLSSPQLPTVLPTHFASLEELEPFSRVQLIAFDLDGTLLKAPDDAPGDRIKRLQGSAKSFGVRITLATGRTLKGAENTLHALGDLGPTPIILYNGSLVVVPGLGKVISHRQINLIVTNEVMRVAREHNAEAFIYTVSIPEMQVDQRIGSWETVWYWGAAEAPAREYNGMPTVRLERSTVDNPATAILILSDPSVDQSNLISKLQALDGISLTSSGNRYIEVRPTGSSKAAAMEDLCRSLQLRQSDVLAVGDNDNDVELLQWAMIGVAVKGASPAAMTASNFVSHFGAERAAIEVLDLVRRAKRLNRTKR